VPNPPRKRFLLIHGVMIAVFAAAMVFASIKYAPILTRLVSHPEKFKAFVDSYAPLSAVAYILVQAAQIVVAVIPGEVVQIAGGYAFGTLLGTLYSVLGAILGTLIVFFAVRLLGYGIVRRLVSAEKLAKFDFLMNNPKSEILLLLLFLIPGIPKDTLTYAAGLTPIKPLRFLLICTLGRLPGLWGSAYIGANLQERDYLPVWILSGVSVVLFVAGLLLKDKIIGKLNRLRHRDQDAPRNS
jgi:uncharacterized membrane protein YdjX (TVP38/TMEM64 family)